MKFHQRIRTIYFKELVDILRDHRTLIAMIVVPIVLYPLLMLGSVQAVSFQAARIEDDVLVLAVMNEAQGASLKQIVAADRAAEEGERRLQPDRRRQDIVPSIDEDKLQLVVAGSVPEIDRLVRERRVHLGVVFDRDELVDAPSVQNKIEWHYDKEDVRSAAGQLRLQAVIERVARRTVDARKAAARLPESFDEPFIVEAVDLSSPPSVLGQVLPLILVLMTITGAIYPAIDLTAGERERGTLESLMATPAPVMDLIVGKFLVVTTVALLGAALNLASVTATVYFGGFARIITSTGGSVPLGTMIVILLALIPFAVLMSAIMIAVCSFARTFKEAQNYVTPVILAVLIPGGIAALPASRLEGVMLVMPVGNMVLLARELLVGAHIPTWAVVIVILSTSLYAGAAVAIAAGVFGRESVVFNDAASWKSLFQRRLIKPSVRPSPSMAFLLVALLFPFWFFVQGWLSPGPGEDARGVMFGSGLLMPILFVLVPAALMAYRKVDLSESFAWRAPSPRFLAAGLLIGLSAWALAHEVNVLQQRALGTPQYVMDNMEILAETLQAMPWLLVLVLLAVVPAICEELLFRGFLLSGVGPGLGKWGGILACAAIFGVFHFFAFRFAVTAGLGIVLGHLCWQSQSIVPGMVAHLVHNGVTALMVIRPQWSTWILGDEASTAWTHVPLPYLMGALAVFCVGIILSTPRQRPEGLALGEPVPA